MHIEELYVDNFGRFRHRSFGPLSQAVTVFYGPNEAGKSTTLAFIRAILLGFPTQYSANHYPSLARGEGGRVTLVDSTGTAYIVERYAGISNGLRVTAPDGPVSDPESVIQRLTGNATRGLFHNVFAFSLDELQRTESLKDSTGVIYSAGQGAPGLPALKKSLGDRKGTIYTVRGNNQEVPRLVNALRDIDEQLRVIEGNAGHYGTLTSRKAEIDEELEAANEELARLNAQSAEIERRRSGWEDWLAFSNCESQLRDMPKYVNFPDNPIPRLENLEAQIRQGREILDEAARQLRQSEDAASVAIPREDLLFDAASIEVIRRGRGSFDKSVEDLPERQAEVRDKESEFEKNLADLGHQWGEAELQTFDTSLPVRDQIEAWTRRIADGDEQARQTQSRLQQQRQGLQDSQAATREAQEKLPPSPPPMDAAALTARQDALRAARGRLEGYERERQNHDNLRGQLNTLAASRETPQQNSGGISLLPIIALALAGVILAVGGILVPGGGTLILGVVCGIVLLLAAVLLWFMGRPTPSAAPSPVASALERQTAEAESTVESARQSLLEQAAVLELAGQPDAAALDTVEAHLGIARDALSAWTGAQRQLEEAQRREKTQEQRVESAVQEHQAAEAAAQQLKQEWRRWLLDRELNQELMPDTMLVFLARVDTVREQLSEILGMRQRVAAVGKDIQEFREQVEPLALRHGLPLNPGNDRQIAFVADELIRLLEEAQAAFSSRQRAMEQTEHDRQQWENRQRNLRVVEEELANLLAAGEAEDGEDFRRRARQHAERQELERQRDEHRRSLERLSGPGERYDAFRDALSDEDPHRLEEESARLSERYAEADAKRNALREERGGIDTELARLTSEEESSGLRIKKHSLEEQLREHAREWSRLTVAEALLEKTRQKFEEERQPSVIRHAQDFFSVVTGQRYQRLYAPIGEQIITVTDATGASKQPAELSRGTREQLYLALRFGLIREFGEHAERLPVVVDEALVNFDPERARLATESFAQLSATNQVLVFTCHPSTAEMFAEYAGAQVVDISEL